MKLYLACLTLLAAVSGSLACSCAPPPLSVEDKICSADFVAKVKIEEFVSSGLNDFDAYYSAVVQSVSLVASGKSLKPGATQLFTAGSGALCGLPNQESGIYVVAGTISSDGELHLFICSSLLQKLDGMLTAYGVKNYKELEAVFADWCSK